MGEEKEKPIRLRLNWGLKGWSLVEGNESLKEDRLGDKRDEGIVVVDMVNFVSCVKFFNFVGFLV